jgi:hypothetical protein
MSGRRINMKEIQDIIRKLENKLKDTSNPYIEKCITEDIANLYRIDQELFYIIDRNK